MRRNPGPGVASHPNPVAEAKRLWPPESHRHQLLSRQVSRRQGSTAGASWRHASPAPHPLIGRSGRLRAPLTAHLTDSLRFVTDNEFDRLNREFYATKPSTYFRDRLTLLAFRAVKSDELAGVLGDGLAWGSLRIVPDNAEATEEEQSKLVAEQERFVVTESQILVHHAAEALLRMFLAHEGNPECPWLRMSALMNVAEFRKEAKELAKSAWPREREAAAGWVFLGGVPSDPSAEWIEHRDASVRLLRILAQRVNGDKNLYNSAKHGLTALGGVGSLHFIPAEPGAPTPDFTAGLITREALLGVEGVNVTYLEREGSQKTGFTWFHKTQWINPEKAAWLTHLAVIQMEALWAVAKWHYLDEPPQGVQVVASEALDALKDFPRGGAVQSFRRSVATETV